MVGVPEYSFVFLQANDGKVRIACAGEGEGDVDTMDVTDTTDTSTPPQDTT